MTWAALIYLIPGAISALALIGTKVTGSDHYYHALVINGIRDNKHRFIVELSNFMTNNYASYPQLLHWVLSFFPEKYALKIGKYSSVLFHLLSAFTLYLFAIEIYPYVAQGQGPSLETFLVYVGVIYVSTPYHYDMENAKNLNISARGIGLFLGQVFTYALVIYSINGQFEMLAVAGVSATLIYMSSQFSTQYLLFSSPLFALLFWDPLLLLIPIVGVLPYFILMPKVAYLSFKGQLNHKRVYVKHLATKYILDIRYSIWRDWVYDFWVKFLSKDSGLSFTKKLGYLITNPLVIVVFSMPFLIPVMVEITGLFHQTGILRTGNILYALIVPVGIGIFIFLATSFRASRFLGEPERYIEFSLGLIAILASEVFESSTFLRVVIILSIILVLSRYYLYVTQVLKRRNEKFSNNLEVIRDRLLEVSEQKEVRLLCNNTFACKTFFDHRISIFWVTLLSEMTGSFHFEEIFKESYSYIQEEIIAPISKEFDVNYLVIDNELTPNIETALNEGGVKVKLLKTYDNYELYEVV